MKVGCWGMEKGKVMKKKKTEKSKTEKIAKALRKAGYGIMELKRNPDLVVNYSDTFTLTIFEAPKSC